MKEPIYVAFSTQKGGAGKTTITVLVASYLHYVKGYNVAIVDCDYPQHSIVEMRKRDTVGAMENDILKYKAFEQFSSLNKKAYRIIEGKPETAIDDAQKLLSTVPDLDYVFFDLPGTINNVGVVRTLAAMDYIFVPIVADRIVMVSSLTFASVLNESLISVGKGNIKGLYMLWNMVDKREKTDLYEQYTNIISSIGVSILSTSLPDSKRFRKELAGNKNIFRSTLFPVDKVLIKGSGIDILTEEILQILNEQRNG